jgi:hypothetical protein
MYLPALRRVRRLSPSQRSEPQLGQDIDQDTFGGFAGNAAWFTWKYVGEKSVLATFHGATIPVVWGESPGDYIHDGTWEPRKVWLVEGVSKVPEYAYSKRVLYIDQDTYRIPYSDLYDRSGQLWKASINSFLFANAPTATAKYRVDYEVPYEPSMTMVDMQKAHATACALPGNHFPGEQGWYVNVGDKEGTTEDQFDVRSIGLPGR